MTYGYNYTVGGNVGPFTAVPAITAAPSNGATSTRGVLLSAQDVDDTGTDLAQGIAIFAQNLPEPSVAILGVVSGLGLLLRRRR